MTSDSGWDTIEHATFLKSITAKLQDAGIRVSIFVNADARFVEGAKAVGADRIEFYTGDFARAFSSNPEEAVKAHVEAAKKANEIGIGINAGHDLNLDNLNYYKESVPGLLEVSIGHALISDALYFGLKNTIQMYRAKLD